MVSISGRSKACIDCKRRRVKCDLAQPLCRRCSKAGIPCQGYKRPPTIWVNRTLERPDVTAYSAIVSSPWLPRDPRLRRLHLLDQLKAECDLPDRDPLQFRTRALQILRGTYLPSKRADDPYPSPTSWLEAVEEVKAPCNALDKALLAFCAIQVRVAGEGSIAYDDTVQMYNGALGEVIKDLSNGNAASDETLCSIVTISLCELFLFSKDGSSAFHALGISEILRRRGATQPSHHWSSLVVRLCIHCTVTSLSQARALTLAPDEWRVLLGPAVPESWNHLLKTAVEVPYLLEKAELLIEKGDRGLMASQHKDVLLYWLHELERWRSQKPSYWVVPARLENPADISYNDKLFPFALHFRSIAHAMEWMFCSALMLQILDAALRLERLGTSMPSDALTDGSLEIRDDGDKLARLLCQCFEYCSGPENGTFAAQAAYSTQLAVQSYFRHRGLVRELAWSKAISDGNGGLRFGIGLRILEKEQRHVAS